MFEGLNLLLIIFSLLVFGVLFYIGIVRLKKINEKWRNTQADLEQFKGQAETKGLNIQAQDILRFQNRLVLGTEEHVVEALPGYFLILGLLGTFIGLSIALQHMQGDNQDKVAVIRALGVKFGSSILGILCNVTFRYVKDYRYDYQKIFNHCLALFEEIKHLREMQEMRLNAQNEATKQKQFQAFFNDLLEAHAQDLKAERKSWGVRYETMGTDLKLAIKEVNQTLATKINGVLEEVRKQVKEDNLSIIEKLSASNTFQTRDLFPKVKSIHENLALQIEQTEKVKKQILDSGSAIIQALGTELKTLYNQIQPIFAQITLSLKSINADTTSSKDSLLNFSNAVTSLTKTLGDTTLQFTTAANEFKNAVTKFESKTGEVLLKIGGIVDTSAKQMEQFSKDTKDIFSGDDGVIAILNSLKGELTQVINEFKISLTGEIKELNRNMENLETINAQIKESQVDLSAALEILNKENSKLEKVIRRTQGQADIFHTKMFGSENEQGRIANSIENSMLKIIQKDDHGLAHNPLFVMQDRLEEIAGWYQKIEQATRNLNHILSTQEPSIFTKLDGIEIKIAHLLQKIQDEPNQLPIAQALRTMEASLGNLETLVVNNPELKPKSISRKPK